MLMAMLGGVPAGCATKPSIFYTLSATSAGGAAAGDPGSAHRPDGGEGLAVAIGPVHFPEFLDRPQIVSRTSDHRLAVDEFHRWGGSLRDDFLRVLGENLGRLLGTSRVLVEPADARFPLDFRVVADVLAFEGTAGGEAVLEVRWTVVDPGRGQALAVRDGTYRSRPATADPEAMVAALSETLSAFSRDLAEQLRGLPRAMPLPAGDGVGPY